MLHSIDGGKTIQYVRGLPHGDNHDVWIDPENPKRMIVGNDGGVHLSSNGGETWFTPPLPIAQFYHVSADNRRPYWVAGAMQDLGTAQGPSDSLAGHIALGDWHDVGGGEAGHVVSDPSDPNIVYAGEYLGINNYADTSTCQGSWDIYCDTTKVGTLSTSTETSTETSTLARVMQARTGLGLVAEPAIGQLTCQ